MDPTDAQINIAKFNRSVIVSALVRFSGACNVRVLALGPLFSSWRSHRYASAIVADKRAVLTPIVVTYKDTLPGVAIRQKHGVILITAAPSGEA
jgi:hypothetical protein